MAEYRTPIDIANRARDHCGVPPIVAFTDDSKGADRTKSIYDKLREHPAQNAAVRRGGHPGFPSAMLTLSKQSEHTSKNRAGRDSS